MSRKISICIIVFILCIMFLTMGIYAGKEPDISKTEPQPETETPVQSVIAKNTLKEKKYAYIVRLDNGQLVVYQEDGKTVYMETGIRENELNDEMKEKAFCGIGFQTPESLFDFLESYSS